MFYKHSFSTRLSFVLEPVVTMVQENKKGLKLKGKRIVVKDDDDDDDDDDDADDDDEVDNISLSKNIYPNK
jgi:hypothetical protein